MDTQLNPDIFLLSQFSSEQTQPLDVSTNFTNLAQGSVIFNLNLSAEQAPLI